MYLLVILIVLVTKIKQKVGYECSYPTDFLESIMSQILSIYTYLFSRHGNHYIYNSESGFFSKISIKLYQQLFDETLDCIYPETLNILLRHKIIVEEEEKYNYYYLTRLKFHQQCFNPQTLGLIIAPTSGCNFACPYCFEGEKETKFMDDNTIGSLIKFINDHKQAENIHITWYGGEPLMAFHVMKKIYERIKKETKLELLPQSIITNGYRMTNSVIDFFKNNPVNSMQITLDGNEKHHNQTRFLKQNHQSTYQHIIDNIDKLVENIPNINISIRINVERDNQNDYSSLKKHLIKKYAHANVGVYPGYIRKETPNGEKMCYNTLFGSRMFNFYELMKCHGVKMDFLPSIAQKGCMVHRISSYIIGPEGELYKCWNDMNHKEKIIGNILSDDLSNKSLFYRYMFETSMFEDIKCKDCLLFPVCSGGCSWLRLKNMYEGKHFDLCIMHKDRHILEDCLIYSIEQEQIHES